MTQRNTSSNSVISPPKPEPEPDMVLFHGTPGILHTQSAVLDPDKAGNDRGSICATPDLRMASLYVLGDRLALVSFPKKDEFTPYAVIDADERTPIQGAVYAFNARSNGFRPHVWPDGRMSGEYRTQQPVHLTAPHATFNSMASLHDVGVDLYSLTKPADRNDFLNAWRAAPQRQNFIAEQVTVGRLRRLTKGPF